MTYIPTFDDAGVLFDDPNWTFDGLYVGGAWSATASIGKLQSAAGQTQEHVSAAASVNKKRV